MFCKKCGAECKDEAKFCPRCGAALNLKPDTDGNKTNQSDILEHDSSTISSNSGIRKRRKLFWFILIVVIAIVVVVIILSKILFVPDGVEQSSKLDNERNALVLVNGFTDRSITDSESAILAAQDAADTLGFKNAFDELSLYLSSPSDGECCYRLQQNYNGIPVYQSYTIVVASETGDALSLYTEAKDIPEDISLEPTVTVEEISASILNYASENWDVINDDLAISELSPDSLVIYNTNELAPACLAYNLTVINGNVYDVIVDAKTGDVLESSTALSDYNARDVSSIPLTDYSYDTDNGLYTIENEEQNIHVYNMSGYSSDSFEMLTQDYSNENIFTFNSIINSLPQATSTNNVFGDTKAEEKNDVDKAIDFIINIENIINFYQNIDPDVPVDDVLLFYNDSYDNGNNARGGILFGEGVIFLGTTYDGTESALLAHEFTHVVTKRFNSATSESSPGIYEGLADVFAFFYTGEWDMDLTKGGNTHRYAINPGLYGYPAKLGEELEKFPDDVDHTFATIVSRAAYEMYDSHCISWSDLEQLWYKTLKRLISKASYSDLSYALQKTALESGFNSEQYQAVVDALNDVGIETEFPEIQKVREEAFASKYVVSPDAKLIVKDENDNEYTDYYAVAETDDNSYLISEGIIDLPEGNYSLLLDVGQSIDTSEGTSNAFVTYEYILQVKEGADDELIIIIPSNNPQENLSSDESAEDGPDNNAISVLSVQGLLELFPYMADELLYEYYNGLGGEFLDDGITGADQVYWLAAWAAFEASDFLNYTDGGQVETRSIDGIRYRVLPSELYANYLRDMFGAEYDISDFIETPGQAIKDGDGTFCTKDGDYGFWDVEVTVENISNTPDADGTYTALARYTDYDSDSDSNNVYYMLYQLRPDESSDYGCVIVDMIPAGNGEIDESSEANELSVSSVQKLLETFPYMANSVILEYYNGSGYSNLGNGITSDDQVYFFAAFATTDPNCALIYPDMQTHDQEMIDGVRYDVLPANLYAEYLRNMFGDEYDISEFIETKDHVIRDNGNFYVWASDYGDVGVEITIENMSTMPDDNGTYSVLAKYSDYDPDTGVVMKEYYMLYRVRPDESSDYGCVIVDMIPAGNGEIDESVLANDSNDLDAMYEAYYQKILEYQNIYGENNIKDASNNFSYIDRLAFIKLFDFNEDGQEEIILGYQNSTNEDSYQFSAEVWGYIGNEIEMVYYKENLDSGVLHIRKNDEGFSIPEYIYEFDETGLRYFETIL